MYVIGLNNELIIVEGEYCVPSYWYKINAERENLFLMKLLLISSTTNQIPLSLTFIT